MFIFLFLSVGFSLGMPELTKIKERHRESFVKNIVTIVPYISAAPLLILNTILAT
jgi:hypothetical protein